ncbi:GNAT family N-acetyltransferase [Candidatus Sulfidibacterium hydrothermale]|uniref:GNAT family N-acetyltransferase n=1 Tax=Candidatus Sulfidibacterium hydrothermale TaxID=2875962 RepID=UPI001F0B4014|nr:GNAT family N-acetyltransferase [Candidatus Sulfidibacterium hydrothermale]UBM61402.1 GNAT family N-acetyltransferase [Candidatus Sulfidibacterium hydrothermale]
MQVAVIVANQSHEKYAQAVCDMIEEAAKLRGTGIAKRKPEYIREKIHKGNAVIALEGEKIVGFCYIESWQGHQFVANSGLIVHPDYRKTGLAKKIKTEIFQLSRKKFPNSKIFGITTSLAVMKINSELGYKPVTFSELTTDETFWKGCESCKNYDILCRTGRKMCLCTGMVYDPAKEKTADSLQKKQKNSSWEQFKKFLKTQRERFPVKKSLYPKISKILHK